MREGEHYKVREWQDCGGQMVRKVMLWLPGAALLNRAFGTVCDVVETEQILGDGVSTPHVTYRARCVVRWACGGDQVGDVVEATANSWEPRFRYVRAWPLCPHCGKHAVVPKRQEPGFICFWKVGGCGAQFPEFDHQIKPQIDQPVRRERETPLEISHAILGRAAARAYTSATLRALGCARFDAPAACEDEEPDAPAAEKDLGRSVVQVDAFASSEASAPSPPIAAEPQDTAGPEKDVAADDWDELAAEVRKDSAPAGDKSKSSVVPVGETGPGPVAVANTAKAAKTDPGPAKSSRRLRAAPSKALAAIIDETAAISDEVEPEGPPARAADEDAGSSARPRAVLPEDTAPPAANGMVGRIAELLGQRRHDPEEVVEIAHVIRVLPKGQTKVTPRTIQEMNEQEAGKLLAALTSRLACENNRVDEVLALVRDSAIGGGALMAAAESAGIGSAGEIRRASVVRGLSQQEADRLLAALKHATAVRPGGASGPPFPPLRFLASTAGPFPWGVYKYGWQDGRDLERSRRRSSL